MIVLIGLGICGWIIFSLAHVPVPEIMGPIIIIGVLRALQYDVPMPPAFLNILTQIILGLFVGSRVTPEAFSQLKKMIGPILVILLWAMTILFVSGIFLVHVTYLDLHTAILASSVAGLPEMIILALATDADLTVVVVAQMLRLIITIVTFPIIFKYWIMHKKSPLNPTDNNNSCKESILCMLKKKVIGYKYFLTKCKKGLLSDRIKLFRSSAYRKNIFVFSQGYVFTFFIALAGSALFYSLGIPAGAMIGAMFFTAAASLLKYKIRTPPVLMFSLNKGLIGIVVSANFSSKTLEVLFSGKIVIPLVIITVITFLSSFLIALIIKRLAGWDFATSFLSSAPSGFSVMTSLAMDYDKDSFRVSILHLCRLIAVKTVIPFVFMFFL